MYQRGGSRDVLLRVTVGISVAEASGKVMAGRWLRTWTVELDRLDSSPNADPS